MFESLVGPDAKRKVRYGLLLPGVLVGSALAATVVAPVLGFLGLLGVTFVGGGGLVLAFASDTRAQSYVNRTTMNGAAGVGIDASADPYEEQSAEMTSVVGRLQVFGAGLGVFGLLVLAVSVLV